MYIRISRKHVTTSEIFTFSLENRSCTGCAICPWTNFMGYLWGRDRPVCEGVCPAKAYPNYKLTCWFSPNYKWSSWFIPNYKWSCWFSRNYKWACWFSPYSFTAHSFNFLSLISLSLTMIKIKIKGDWIYRCFIMLLLRFDTNITDDGNNKDKMPTPSIVASLVYF